MTRLNHTHASTAHYFLHGIDDKGRTVTSDAEGFDTLEEAAVDFGDKVNDCWKEVFAYRVERVGLDAPVVIECTPQVARVSFGQWLDAFGLDDDFDCPIPEIYDVQLERLTISTEAERRSYRLGERHALEAA